jgi:hypothetical protein
VEADKVGSRDAKSMSAAGTKGPGRRAVVKRLPRASSCAPNDGDLVLLPPRLQPLSAEECTEAIALLSDLVVAAARRCGDSRDPETADTEPREARAAA